jgi:tetratricopeptide (TPR) repeat protein
MDGKLNLQREISGIQAQVTDKNLAKFANNVDNHIFLIMVDDAIEHKTFNEQSLLKQKLRVIQNTYLFEQGKKVSSSLGDDASKESISTLEKESQAKLESLKKASDKIFKIFESDDFKKNVENNTRGADLLVEFELTEKDIQAAFDYAKCQYELGNYKESEEMLTQYLKVSRSSNFLAANWGLLNSQIMSGKLGEALETFSKLKDLINKEKITDQDKLLSKNMLVNTSFFLFHHAVNPAEFLIDVLKQHESILASASIHLLRYYIVACLMSKNFDALNGSIMSMIQSNSYRYRDSFTLFIETLLENFDYSLSAQMIDDLEKACDSDFFLRRIKGKVIEGAKNLILSTYSMVYHVDDVKEMSQELKIEVNDEDKFASKFQSHENLNDRLSDVAKAQVGLKDALQHVH